MGLGTVAEAFPAGGRAVQMVERPLHRIEGVLISAAGAWMLLVMSHLLRLRAIVISRSVNRDMRNSGPARRAPQ